MYIYIYKVTSEQLMAHSIINEFILVQKTILKSTHFVISISLRVMKRKRILY